MRIRRGNNSFAMLNLCKETRPISFKRMCAAVCLVYALFVHSTCKESKFYREVKISYLNAITSELSKVRENKYLSLARLWNYEVL